MRSNGKLINKIPFFLFKIFVVVAAAVGVVAQVGCVEIGQCVNVFLASHIYNLNILHLRGKNNNNNKGPFKRYTIAPFSD